MKQNGGDNSNPMRNLQAEELFQDGEFAKATDLLLTESFEDLSSADRLLLTDCLFELERYQEIISLVDTLDSAELYYRDLAAVCCLRIEDYDQARVCIENALEEDESPRLYHLLASAYCEGKRDYELSEDQREKIKATLQKAVSMDSCPLGAFLWLESLLGYDDADIADRADLLREAISKHPNAEEPRLRLSSWFTYRLDQPDRAVEVLKPLLDKRSPNPHVWLHAFYAAQRLAHHTLAITCLESVKFDDETDRSKLDLLKGDALSAAGRFQEALDHYPAPGQSQVSGEYISGCFGRAWANLQLENLQEFQSDLSSGADAAINSYQTLPGYDPIYLDGESYGYDFAKNIEKVCDYYLETVDQQTDVDAHLHGIVSFLKYKLSVDSYDSDTPPPSELLVTASTLTTHPAIDNYFARYQASQNQWSDAVRRYFDYAIWACRQDFPYLSAEFLNELGDEIPVVKKAERKKILSVVRAMLPLLATDANLIDKILRPFYTYFWRNQLIKDGLSAEIVELSGMIVGGGKFDREASWDFAYHLNKLGKVDDAEKAYRDLLKNEPNNSSALHNLSLIREDRGFLEEAQELSERAASISGDDRIIVDRLKNLKIKLRSLQIEKKASVTGTQKSPKRPTTSSGRKGLSKKTRFEVFKRDSFTCQYCGRKSPDVVLEADHIDPVSKGGTNDILNLITSCKDCNAGKSDTQLSDNSALEKRRKQLEELQERKEQIEMMLEWQKELKNLDDHTIEKVSEYWAELVSPYSLNENGKSTLKKLFRQFDVSEVMAAMRTAAEQYVQFENNEPVQETVEKAWSKVGGICRVTQVEREKPYMRDLYYVRGILRNRLSYTNDWVIMSKLEEIVTGGGSIDQLKAIALEARNWTQWQEMMAAYHDEVCKLK